MNNNINRQTAIDLVKNVCNAAMSECESWYDPEIKDEVYKDIREVDAILKCNKRIRIALQNMLSAEPEIIRCKNCKHYRSYAGVIDGYCDMAEWYGRFQNPNDFCSRAKRRIDE